MSKSLGQKIKSFRNRSSISQFDLELAVGLSAGNISRIENDMINPTKETILKIATELNLSQTEISYLLDINHADPTKKEIEETIKLINSHFKKKTVFAYLLDNKSKILEISDGFKILAKLVGLDLSKIYSSQLAEVVFNPDLGLRKYIKDFDAAAISVIAVLKQERDYLMDEAWWNDLLERLKRQPDFERLWNSVSDEELNLLEEEKRTVEFDIKIKRLKFVYTWTNLPKDPRFVVVEYKLARSIKAFEAI